MTIISLVFPPLVQAINLGSILKTNYAEVRKGETAMFKALFWNTDDSSLPIELTMKQAPEGWVVIIRPNDFTLNQSKPENPPYEKGVEYMNLQNTIIRTTPVDLFVKVSKSAKQGEHEVIINVNAGKTTGGISILTERNLKFTVNVVKGSRPKEMETPNFTALSEDISNKLTGMVSTVTEPINALFLSVSIIAVIGVVLIIKRIF